VAGIRVPNGPSVSSLGLLCSSVVGRSLSLKNAAGRGILRAETPGFITDRVETPGVHAEYLV